MRSASKNSSPTKLAMNLEPSLLTSTCDDALRATDLQSIQHLGVSEIVELQSILMHGNTFGIWETPAHWAPFIQEGLRRIDLWRRILSYIPVEHKAHFSLFSNADSAKRYQINRAQGGYAFAFQILIGAVLFLKKYLVLCRIGPSGLGNRGNGAPLDVTTLIIIAYQHLPALLADSITRHLIASRSSQKSLFFGIESSKPIKYFEGYTPFNLQTFSSSARGCLLTEIKRMKKFRDLGFWHDAPLSKPHLNKPTAVAGSAEKVEAEKISHPHLPLPDDFIAHMGTCSLWLTQELSGSILTAADFVYSMFSNLEHEFSQLKKYHQYLHQVEKFLQNFKWTDSKGVEIGSLPFELSLSKFGSNSHLKRKEVRVDNVWPPRNFSQFMGLMNTLQAAHLFIISMSMAARRSELLHLQRDCLIHSKNGLSYAIGKTFKLVDAFEGEERDWVLPNAAVNAIERQRKLVCIGEKIGSRDAQPPSKSPLFGNHLWAQLGTSASSRRTEPLIDINKALVKYAKDLGLEANPGGQRMRSHRIRKTIARLVALALIEAPKILKQVFGHKSIEMTLTYILSDENLRADIEVVSRELRIMRAKEAVEAMMEAEAKGRGSLQFGGYGGPAALALQRAVNQTTKRARESGVDWGASDALELASILTLGGKAWQLVRQGVVCTKFPGTESGPCNKSKGHPEPASCSSLCHHRLEEGFLREDVDASISAAIEGYKSSALSKDFLVQAHWAGQIRTNISRFSDLHNKWMEDPTVREILQGNLQMNWISD